MPAYRRMPRDDRLVLEKMYNAGHPLRENAAVLGFAPKSLYREIKVGLYTHRNWDYSTCRKYSTEKGQRATTALNFPTPMALSALAVPTVAARPFSIVILFAPPSEDLTRIKTALSAVL